MKKFYLFVIAIFSVSFSFANPVITAIQNGSWSTKGTWDKGRTPINGDTIVIPSGRTVSYDDAFSVASLQNVYVKVSGTLQLGGFLSSLSLDNQSTILINAGGKLTSSGFWQNITIGGQQVFASLASPISGPQIANSGTNGFTFFNPLPVKFVGFTVTRRNNDALIQWSTSEEVNANMYEVERSLDGTNWNTIAYVAAIGNASAVNSYAYTDKNISSKVVYYRIKEVDFDGKTTFTKIQSIKTDAAVSNTGITISSVQNKVLLQFSQQIKGNLMVRFISLNGQVVDQQQINSPIGQVVLNSKVTGNYIISISNGQDISAAKQVIL